MKKLLHFTGALVLLLCAVPAQAQERSIQIGGSNIKNLGTPNVPRKNTFFFESNYTPAILANNGLKAGDVIKKVKFPYAVPADKNFENFDIDMWFGATTKTDIPYAGMGQPNIRYSEEDVAELQHIVDCGWFEPDGTKTAPAYFECTLNPPVTYDGGYLRFVMTGNCMNTDELPDDGDYSDAGMAWLFSASTDRDYRTSTYEAWYQYPDYLTFWEQGSYKFYRQTYVLSLVLVLEDPSGIEENAETGMKIYTTTDQLHVEAASPIQSVKVYAANGTLCLSATPAEEQAILDTSNWKGIYMVEVQTDNAVKQAKVQF